MSSTYRFHCHSEALMEVLTSAFTRRGLRVQRSFDLRSALAAQSAQSCACPLHGTAGCDCEYAVLLIYGGHSVPVALTVHGHDGISVLEMVDATMPPQESRFAQQLLGGLVETTRALLARDEPSAAPSALTRLAGAT